MNFEFKNFCQIVFDNLIEVIKIIHVCNDIIFLNHDKIVFVNLFCITHLYTTKITFCITGLFISHCIKIRIFKYVVLV